MPPDPPALHEVTVAEERDGRLTAFSAVHDGWLEQLCVDPPAQSRGIGRAQAFYERAGLVLVAEGERYRGGRARPHLRLARVRRRGREPRR